MMLFSGYVLRHKLIFTQSLCPRISVFLCHRNSNGALQNKLCNNTYNVYKRKGIRQENFIFKPWIFTNFHLFANSVNCDKIADFQYRMISMSSICKKDDNESEKWEDILNNKEKRENIESIPVKKENVYTIPNLITCSRIAFTPYIGYLIVNSNYNLALGLFLFAGFTDLLDGYIARTWPSQQSAAGSALDPLADKILVAVISLSLTYMNIIPLPLTLLFIARDMLLIVGVFYLRYKTCPRPVTLKRFFDPTLVNTKLAPTMLSKVNTALQISLVCFSIAAPVFGFVEHLFLKSLWAVTATTTLASGINYIYQKDTVKILKDEEIS